MTGKKIGIMGGTFDPLHNAHIQVAQAALVECSLDRIDFVPSAYPPHKAGETGADFSHRVNMVKLICGAIKEFSCNEIEGSLAIPSYSIDTLSFLQKSLPDGCLLYFIIGVDAFLEIDLWKSFKEVLQRVNFIISPRQGYRLEKIDHFLAELGYQYKNNRWQSRKSFKYIHLLKAIPQEISSTMLKSMLRQETKIDHLVPLKVNQYIKTHALYSAN